MEDDRTRTGYDQTDEYTQKNATIGIEPPPAYEQEPPKADGSYRQQPYLHTSTNVIVTQPQQCTSVVIQPRPFDWMVPSILACLCCCWPFGLCAICYASQVNSLWSSGDYEGARRKANTARNLVIASVVFGIIITSCVIGLRVYLAQHSSSEYETEEYQNEGW